MAENAGPMMSITERSPWLVCPSHAGPLWWSRLCPHPREHCSQNGRQGHQERLGLEDTHRESSELAHVCMIDKLLVVVSELTICWIC